MPELKWQSDDCYNLEELMLGRVRVGFVKIEYSDSDGEPSRYFWENEIEDQPVWRDVEKNQSHESLVEAQSLLEASVRHSLGLDTVKPLVEWQPIGQLVRMVVENQLFVHNERECVNVHAPAFEADGISRWSFCDKKNRSKNVDNAVAFIVEKIAAIKNDALPLIDAYQKRVEELEDCLQSLVDCQNGRPLPSYTEWDTTMEQAYKLLGTQEEVGS